MNIDLISDIKVLITIELGKRKMTLREIMSLTHGTILELTTKIEEPLNFYVNGKMFGNCEIVQMPNAKYGMRVLEIFNKK